MLVSPRNVLIRKLSTHFAVLKARPTGMIAELILRAGSRLRKCHSRDPFTLLHTKLQRPTLPPALLTNTDEKG